MCTFSAKFAFDKAVNGQHNINYQNSRHSKFENSVNVQQKTINNNNNNNSNNNNSNNNNSNNDYPRSPTDKQQTLKS